MSVNDLVLISRKDKNNMGELSFSFGKVQVCHGGPSQNQTIAFQTNSPPSAILETAHSKALHRAYQAML